jgi:hypothetical protein
MGYNGKFFIVIFIEVLSGFEESKKGLKLLVGFGMTDEIFDEIVVLLQDIGTDVLRRHGATHRE